MKKHETAMHPSYWASLSGGKDSLYMFHFILQNADKYPLDGVVHFELEIDYPFISDVVDYAEEECRKRNIAFRRIRPRKTWLELYAKRGFPTRNCRWCNSEYKLDAMRRFSDELKNKGLYSITYIGYCVDEERRMLSQKKTNPQNVYPLAENGIIEATILEWAKKQPIFNNYYKYNRRCGCMCCPLASMNSSAYLRYFYPDEFSKNMELAKRTETMRCEQLGRPFSVWSSNPKYNTEYRIKRVQEKYLPELLKAMELEHWNVL